MLLNNNTTTASYVSSTGNATNNNLSAITIPQGYILGSSSFSSSSSSGGTITTGSTTGSIFYNYSSSISMIELEVLGKKFTVYPDTIQQTYLAQIDFLGIGYWESLKKMSVSPISNEEIKNFLDKSLKSWQRQQKIEKIISQA